MLWVKLQTPALKIFFWQNTCESLFPTFRPPIWLTTSSKSSITAYSSLFKKFPLRNIFFITKVFKFWRPLLFFYESDIWWSYETKLHLFVAPWCSGYHYCTTSFKKAWIQFLLRLNSCPQQEDLQWWKYLTVGRLEIRLKLIKMELANWKLGQKSGWEINETYDRLFKKVINLPIYLRMNSLWSIQI